MTEEGDSILARCERDAVSAGMTVEGFGNKYQCDGQIVLQAVSDVGLIRFHIVDETAPGPDWNSKSRSSQAVGPRL